MGAACCSSSPGPRPESVSEMQNLIPEMGGGQNKEAKKEEKKCCGICPSWCCTPTCWCSFCGCCLISIVLQMVVISICAATGAAVVNETYPVVQEGIDFVNWWVLPEVQKYEDLEKLKVNGKIPEDPPIENGNRTWGVYSPTQGPKVMYQATKVAGLFKNVPDEMKGVFWMDGNGDAEELVVMQLGRWFEKDNLFVQTVAPYSWGWSYGVPLNAPFGGALYRFGRYATAAVKGTYSNMGLSYKFEKCPPDAQYCNKDDPDPMGYANIQLKLEGSMNSTLAMQIIPIPPTAWITEARYELEKLDDGSGYPGSLWKRSIYWGPPGKCREIEFGTYTLKKIINNDGEPHEPYFSQWVEYMGKVDLLLWTGWNSAEAREYDIGSTEAQITAQAVAAGNPAPSFSPIR